MVCGNLSPVPANRRLVSGVDESLKMDSAAWKNPPVGGANATENFEEPPTSTPAGMPATWKQPASGPFVVQPEIVTLVAPRLRRVKTLVTAAPQRTGPKSLPFALSGGSESAMDRPLVPSKARPREARRMKARGWPWYRPLPTISLYSLMPVAFVKTQPEPASIRSFRLLMTPSCQRNAWFVPERVEDVPTIQAPSLRALA